MLAADPNVLLTRWTAGVGAGVGAEVGAGVGAGVGTGVGAEVGAGVGGAIISNSTCDEAAFDPASSSHQFCLPVLRSNFGSGAPVFGSNRIPR